MRCSAAGGGGDARRKRVYGWRGGAASFRGADTAEASRIISNTKGVISFNARGGAHKVQSVVTNVGLFGFERTIDYPKK